MKAIIAILILATGLSFGGAARADYQDGSAAYRSGDYASALREFRPLAEQGDADAQFLLGVMYINGQGVLEDANEAMKWFRLAAEQGDADAQFSLGRMYAKGEGVIEDDKEAVKWYRLAAEQGFARAQVVLGAMYVNGEGVIIEDAKEAVRWFRLAAEQGDAGAQARLGALYGDGKGILQDTLRAHMWSNIASANGYKNGSELRDIMAERMTPAQIEKAQDMARRCMGSDYKDC